MSVTLSEINDKELYDLVEKANLAEKLMADPTWGLLKEASNRIVERAVSEFALKANPDDLVEIIKLQTIIRMYKFGFLKEVEILKQESEFAFQEAKERGVIGNFLSNVKERISR